MRAVRRSNGRFAIFALVVVLAVVACLLAIFALRGRTVPDAGDLPGSVPTWGISVGSEGSATPSSTPSRGTEVGPPFTIGSSGLGVRSGSTECGAAQSIEVTTDGGRSWQSASFGALDVTQVQAINVVSDTQIDLVAGVGPTCDPTVVSSYTAGEYWQSYPERLGEVVFVQPGNGSSLQVRGLSVASPCKTVSKATLSSGGTAIACDAGVYYFSQASGAWSQLSDSPASSIAITPDSAGVVAARSGSAGCAGVELRSYSLALGVQEGSVIGCAATSADSHVSLSVSAGRWFLWAGDVLSSPDQGVTWEKA